MDIANLELALEEDTDVKLNFNKRRVSFWYLTKLIFKRGMKRFFIKEVEL